MFSYLLALCLCLYIQYTNAVSDNVEVITSCWLITLQDNQKFKIVHDIRVYMIKKCFSILPLADSKQGFDYTHYIKDLKNKDIIPNPQLDDIISSIVKSLETEFNKDIQSEIQSTVPPLGVFGMNFNYSIVFPILGGIFLVYFVFNAIRALKRTPKKKK
ncbi:unnamed protein product [Paramecium sonneborni]|uniref:Uncharacterized protein n=1 Tax=Paramecium sonneborni TaxID=65129 RepID=A0A8S1RVV5_9CILI|nr:unnamed protein product [Paramecium sonneborni]